MFNFSNEFITGRIPWHNHNHTYMTRHEDYDGDVYGISKDIGVNEVGWVLSVILKKVMNESLKELLDREKTFIMIHRGDPYTGSEEILGHGDFDYNHNFTIMIVSYNFDEIYSIERRIKFEKNPQKVTLAGRVARKIELNEQIGQMIVSTAKKFIEALDRHEKENDNGD